MGRKERIVGESETSSDISSERRGDGRVATDLME
jgi:hypothetical protein